MSTLRELLTIAWKDGAQQRGNLSNAPLGTRIHEMPKRLALFLDNAGTGDVADERLFDAAPEMLQALREVAGDCYALEGVALGPRCVFCLIADGEPHDADCTMQFVNAAIAKAEGRAA